MKRVPISIYVFAETAEKITEFADRDYLTVSNYVNKIMTEHVESETKKKVNKKDA